ncbi:signal peptidase I [Chloroflexota bacterium]
MKRALGLIFLIAACLAGVLSVRGAMPFMPIFGSSMEPTLQSGALMMIEPVDGEDVKVGDIIVYNVPASIRDYYNYPPVVAHRVVEVKTKPILGFRTKGDNTGEDPFTIRPKDLRGTVGNQIPHLGIPLLFFQSQQGFIFVIIALTLLTFFLYGGELGRGGETLHRVVFSPVIDDTYRHNRILSQKIETTEQKMDSTQQALLKFSAAIEAYATHLASHTSAIQGLSEASHELKKSSAEQNRVLMHMMDTMGQPRTEREVTIPKVAPVAPEMEQPAPAPEPEKVEPKKTKIPPGCAINRQALAKRILEVSQKSPLGV